MKASEMLRLVASDAKADAMSLDGKPFTGRTVAEQLGCILASIQAIALAVAVLYDSLEREGS